MWFDVLELVEYVALALMLVSVAIWRFFIDREHAKLKTEPRMSPGDEHVIWMFVIGNESFREKAVAVHHKYIPTIGVRGNDLQRFMAEVDHPCPDYSLRADYKEKVVERLGVK